MQSKVWIVLKYVIAIFIIWGGVQHFLTPEAYKPFVPDFLPFEIPIIYISGVLEITLGLIVFIKKYAYYGMYGIFILMLLFLPIHLMDLFIENPAIGSRAAAYIRLPIQLLLIGVAWIISRKLKSTH